MIDTAIPDPTSTEVLDEVNREGYLFVGADQLEVDSLIEAWSERGERTWWSRRPVDRDENVELSLDDVRGYISHR
jgi:hypothetical protein